MECPLCDFGTADAQEMYQHFARRSYDGQHKGNVPKDFAKVIGFNYAGGFPDVEGVFDVGGLEVTILPRTQGPVVAARWHGDSGRGAKRKGFHRILVTCPSCSRQIPAGRLHQHGHGKHEYHGEAARRAKRAAERAARGA